MSKATDKVFRALSAPPRRQVLDLLRTGERPVGELQRHFRMSQPALSRHLQVLRGANLVKARREGRTNVYRLNAQPLAAAMDWMAHYQDFWLNNFEKLNQLFAEEE